MPVSMPAWSTDRPDAEALQQAAASDVLGQLLDRDPGLDAPDVRLAEHELVEGDVARGREGDLLNDSRHGMYSATSAESLSLGINSSVRQAQPSNSLIRKEKSTELDAQPPKLRGVRGPSRHAVQRGARSERMRPTGCFRKAVNQQNPLKPGVRELPIPNRPGQ